MGQRASGGGGGGASDAAGPGAAAGGEAAPAAAVRPYAAADLRELERLAAQRGLLPEKGGLDRALLATLLAAWDAGAAAAVAAQRGEARGLPPWAAGAQEAAGDSAVLGVLRKLRDAPGHMGVDIGGTLVKMALAIPYEVAAQNCFPKTFGLTGRTHGDLEFGMRVRGEMFVVRFVSGSTSQMERAVQQLGMQRLSFNKTSVLRSISSATDLASALELEDSADEVEPFSEEEPYSMNPEDVQHDTELKRQLSGWSDVGSASYRPVRRVTTAGGGACKFAPLFRDALRVEIEPVKELGAVVDGLLLLARHRTTVSQLAGSTGGGFSGNDLFTLNRDGELDSTGGGSEACDLFTVGEDGRPLPLSWPESLFPLIVVNMGSGVSILRVDSERANDYVRVGGTACGGGTFLGLARALTSATTFEEALALAEGGDAARVDKLVSDIYGVEGSASLGLPGSLTASNFGKLSEGCSPSEQDLARSVLQMVTQQSVLLAIAFARHADCLGRVFFVGGFVDKPNHLARASIAANFRSLGGCAYFLRHSDFLGALGSLQYALQVTHRQ